RAGAVNDGAGPAGPARVGVRRPGAERVDDSAASQSLTTNAPRCLRAHGPWYRQLTRVLSFHYQGDHYDITIYMCHRVIMVAIMEFARSWGPETTLAVGHLVTLGQHV